MDVITQPTRKEMKYGRLTLNDYHPFLPRVSTPRNTRSPDVSNSGSISRITAKYSSEKSPFWKKRLRKDLSDDSEAEESSSDPFDTSDLKIILSRRKSDIDIVENNCKDVIRKKRHYSLGDSVNHVWNVYDNKRNLAGFYKVGRNGNVISAYMETLVYEISTQFGVDKWFAATVMKDISPRSQKHMKIKKRSSDIRKRSCDLKKKPTNLSDLSESNPIEISFQKKIEGEEIRYIKEERDTTLFGFFCSQYRSLTMINVVPIYQKCFVKSSIISALFGFWDGHTKNIILNRNGFRFFDNARSLPHSNHIIVWGDKMRLPYYTCFTEEEEFYRELNDQDIKNCLSMVNKFVHGFSTFKHYFKGDISKKILDKIPGSWFDPETVTETLKNRIDNLITWLTTEKGKKSLDEMICYLFPHYRFFALLYIVVYDFNRDLTDHQVWKKAMSRVGKEDDLLFLIDSCYEKGIDPHIVYKISLQPEDRVSKIRNLMKEGGDIQKNRLIYDIMYNNFSFDFKECVDESNWVISFLNRFSIHRGVNIFDTDNLSLPGNCVDIGYLDSIQESLFKKGYFLTFYTQNKGVYCSVCHIDKRGSIKIRDIEIRFDGNILFMLKKRKIIDNLNTFCVWLDRFKHRSFTDTTRVDKFVKKYINYYKDIYLIKVLDHLQISYIEVDKYEITTDNVRQMKEYEEEYLMKDGIFVYVYPGDDNKRFEFKYRSNGGVVKSENIDIDTSGKIVIGSEKKIQISKFRKWFRDISN